MQLFKLIGGHVFMDYNSVRRDANMTGVDFDWALNKRKDFVNAEIEKLRDKIRKLYDLKDQTELEKKLTLENIHTAVKEIKTWTWELSKLSPDWDKNKLHLDDHEIQAAKSFPIENLLPNPVRIHMTKCPFHEESTASGYTKGNFLYCFSCNRGWDTIQLVMELHGLSFRDAVLEILGRQR
jgi:DNA primase